MIKTVDNSRIEVWSNGYINDVSRRQEQDRTSVIVQIECGNNPNEYIVEIVDEK